MEKALRITFAVDCHLTAGRRDDVEGREPSWPALDTVRSCCRRTFDALKISILKINAQCNFAQLQRQGRPMRYHVPPGATMIPKLQK